MAYENFMSKTDDVVWLAYQFKNKLGSKISINKMGLYKEVLEGKYNLKGHDRGIDFGILYSDKEFLRVSIGEIGAYASSYEDRLFVLNEIKNAISSIFRDGVSLGEPSVFYNVRDEEYMIPHLGYIYSDKEETIKAFQDKTIFDDGGIPEDVIIFDGVEDRHSFIIKKVYSYDKETYDKDYSIIVNAKYLSNSNVDNKILKLFIIESLDILFKLSNRRKECELLDKYLSITGDLSCLVNAIRSCTFLLRRKNCHLV